MVKFVSILFAWITDLLVDLFGEFSGAPDVQDMEPGGNLNQVYFLILIHSRWQVREGLHYNPYFPGGAIAMPKMLTDGGVEYEDGTPATESQVRAPYKRADHYLDMNLFL